MKHTISKHTAWVMWLLISLFYAYQYILRVLPNILMPEIMSRFHIDAGSFGQFSGLYYLGYAGAHIPLGILLDRKGPKLIIPICIMLTAIGILPLIFAEQWIYPSIGRVLIGIGSSAAILGAFKIIRMGFPENQFSRMLGMCVTIGLLGAIYGGQPVDYCLQVFGSKTVLTTITLVGLLLAACIYWLVPHQPIADTKPNSITEDIKGVLSNYKVLSICLLAGLMVGPLEGFADVWGSQFLRIVYGFDETVSTTLPSFMFFGMCFGASALTYLADKTQAHFKTIIMAAFIMAIGFIYTLSGIGNALSLYILFSLIGIMCAYQIIAIYKASTFVPHHLVGLANACANMIIMAFGYVFHSTMGSLIQSKWDGTMINNTPVYSPEAFTYGLSVIPIGLLIGGFGFMWSAKKKGK